MATGKKTRVIHYALGPIGIEAAKVILKKQNMGIVGAVDISDTGDSGSRNKHCLLCGRTDICIC